MSFVSYLFNQLQTKPEAQRWVVAFSGGLDSTVLLHSLIVANRQLIHPRDIVAIHVNHQLSAKADQWQQHCQQQAQQWGVEFYTEQVSVSSQGQGLEAAARQQRYEVFTRFLCAGDWLVLAHHQDDQAETVLLRLLRGAGVLGLGAMNTERQLGKGHLWRPLLGISQEQFKNYAADNNLSWVEDASNADTSFDRNFLRQHILPPLADRWRQAKSQLANTAERLQQAQTLLDDLAKIDLQALDARTERCGCSICWCKTVDLSAQRLNNLLRYWCGQQGFTLPEATHLQQLAAQFFNKTEPSTATCVQWGNVESHYFDGRIYLSPLLSSMTEQSTPVLWDMKKRLVVPGMGHLTATQQVTMEKVNHLLSQKKLEGKEIAVARRQGGERCTPAGRQHSQTLKKLLQEYSLETWLRDRVPLVFVGEELAAVGNLWVCAEFIAEEGELGWLIDWQPF